MRAQSLDPDFRFRSSRGGAVMHAWLIALLACFRGKVITPRAGSYVSFCCWYSSEGLCIQDTVREHGTQINWYDSIARKNPCKQQLTFPVKVEAEHAYGRDWKLGCTTNPQRSVNKRIFISVASLYMKQMLCEFCMHLQRSRAVLTRSYVSLIDTLCVLLTWFIGFQDSYVHRFSTVHVSFNIGALTGKG